MNKTRKSKHKNFKLTTLGFTLIELLTVMVVLGVILTIITPFVFKTIEKVKMNVWANSAYAMMNAVRKEKYVSIKELGVNERLVFIYEDGVESSNIQGMKLEYTGTPPESGKVIINDDGDIAIAIYNGAYCAKKEFNEISVVVYAEDEPSECTIIEDREPPMLIILGENPAYVNVGTNYIDDGARAIDEEDGDLTNKIIVNNNINIMKEGTYSVIYEVSNFSGNLTTATRIVIVVDNVSPIVIFSPLGNDIYQKSHSTKVTVSDEHGSVDSTSLKYLWTSSSLQPNESSINNLFNNNDIITNSLGTGNYYLWIKAKDNSGNQVIEGSDAFAMDNTKPTITVLGNNPLNISVGQGFIDPGATADDEHSGISGTITTIGSVNVNSPGTYTLTYSVSDKAGNSQTATRTVNVIADAPPIVTFSPSGNSTYEKSQSTKVNASPQQGSLNTRQYQWTTSSSFPTGGSWTNFNSGATITQASGTGNYYLHIQAIDNYGNETKATSSVFRLDNTKPTITVLGNNPLNISVGQGFTDPGATADDEHSGISGSITTTGSVNVNLPGTYTLTYNVSDKAGNSQTAIRTVIVKDNTPPTVLFSPNGNSTYEKTQSTKVTVTNQYGTVSSRKYQWTTTSIFPTSGTWTSFNSGSTITQASGTGDYYLHIQAIDNSENEANITSNAFKLDNTNPSVSSITIDAGNIEATSFTITRNGDATDTDSGLAISPYKYQISTDNSNWITKCTNNTTSCNVIGLNGETAYYYRICAIDKVNNETCTSSKSVMTNFLCPGTVITDSRDGEKYCTVQIGNKWWFAEDLRYTGNGCLNNGWSFMGCKKTEPSDWSSNEVQYQWLAAMNGNGTEGSQGACPSGWHVPTDLEWRTLEAYVDSSSGINWNVTGWRGTDVGKKLRSKTYWRPNVSCDDTYAFKAIPTGYRPSYLNHDYALTRAFYWTSTGFYLESYWETACYRMIDGSYNSVYSDINSTTIGHSVRCIKN